jgi:hypothetical protein
VLLPIRRALHDAVSGGQRELTRAARQAVGVFPGPFGDSAEFQCQFLTVRAFKETPCPHCCNFLA